MNYAPGKIPLGGKSPWKCIHSDSQTLCKVWLTSIERRQCSNEANTRNTMKFAAVPQTRKPISAISGPKFAILWRYMEEVLLFNRFFPILHTCLSCKDRDRQSSAMVPRWRIFGHFFASCIYSEPCPARFTPAFQIRTKSTPCVEVWYTSNVRRLRLGEEKKKKEETTGQKYNVRICYAGQP